MPSESPSAYPTSPSLTPTTAEPTSPTPPSVSPTEIPTLQPTVDLDPMSSISSTYEADDDYNITDAPTMEPTVVIEESLSPIELVTPEPTPDTNTDDSYRLFSYLLCFLSMFITFCFN